MHEYLLFRLYGPLQSWGDVAVGEIRPSRSVPGRSALLGLLACVLGVRRHEEERLAALDRSLRLAVRIDAPGRSLADYHTVQTPTQRRGRVYMTRRDELGAKLWGPMRRFAGEKDLELSTILTRRDYLADACFTACVWLEKDGAPAPHSLAELAEALARPRLAPFLGRKSCPPGLPFAPRRVSAPSVAEALAAYGDNEGAGQVLSGTLKMSWPRRVHADPGHGDAADQTMIVGDRVLHHGRRQFGPRPEHMYLLPGPPAVEQAGDAAGPLEEA